MRKVMAAAVQTDDGVVHFMLPPHRHHHIAHAMNRSSGDLIIARGMQGFLMSDCTFADRREAARCAIEAGQIEFLTHPPELYSEDLW